MDFKALMTKLDTIEKRKILTEGEDRPAAKKKETTWTDKSGKQHPATRVQGSKSVAADKEADKERKKHDKDLDESMFKGSIAKALSEEFGYEIDEAGPVMTRSDNEIWWDNNFPGQPFPGEAAAEKAYNDRMASGQKNLDAIKGFFGGGKKPDAGAATKPAAAAPAAAPAAVPPGINPETGDAYTPVGDAPLTTPPGAEPEEPQVSTLAEPPGAEGDGGAATKPAAGQEQQTIDPAKIAKFKALLDKLQKGKAPAAATESVSKLADDQILAIIKSIK